MYIPYISSKMVQFGYTEINFRFVDDDGVMPTVFRPYKWKSESVSDDDIQSAGTTIAQSLTDEWIASQQPPPDYYEILKNVLDSNITPGTYDAVRQVLAEFGYNFVLIGDIKLDVAAIPVEFQDLPIDAETALETRLDQILFPGAFSAVKTVLKAMGFGEVQLIRTSNLTL